MKRVLLCVLAVALVLGALPVSALAADKYVGMGLMYEDSEVKLNPKKVPASELSWSSGDENVATVAEGVVSSHFAGVTIVSASLGDQTAYCGLVVLPREISVRVGESVSLPRGGKEKYYVEHRSVAGVSGDGVIVGLTAGATRIGVVCGKQKMIVGLNVTETEDIVRQSAAAGLDCADTAEQIVLVDYQGGSAAKLSIHEKQNGLWQELYSCTAYVGRNGIGKTREGDGKTPAGSYNLTQPFGIKSDPGANMEYTKVTGDHYWCGTSGSEYYNRLVDMRVVDRKNTSSDEYLINYAGYYDYCMFIDYNASGEAGRGSCIFLHCKGSKDSTAGCIAVSETVMKNIIRWARPGVKIVIR